MSRSVSRLWMIAYDIQDDKIRRAVHTLLKNYGEKVQFSVFECRLYRQQLETLRIELVKKIEDGDTIRYYPICSCCETKIFCQGVGQETVMEKYFLL